MKVWSFVAALAAMLGLSCTAQAAELTTPVVGDETNMTLYIVLGVVAAAIVVIAIIGLRRTRKKKESMK